MAFRHPPGRRLAPAGAPVLFDRVPVRVGELQEAGVADRVARFAAGLLHPDLGIAHHDAVVDDFAEVGLAGHDGLDALVGCYVDFRVGIVFFLLG